MNAKNMSTVAKKACRAQHFTPREFEIVNADLPAMADDENQPEYVVIRAWNSKRTVELTNHDLAYAHRYL